jgi:hypothetical protein
MRSPGRRLYLDRATRSRVLEEGDPDAGFLLVGAGGEVPSEYRELVKEYEASRKAEPKPEAKQADEPETKERAQAKTENKGRS